MPVAEPATPTRSSKVEAAARILLVEDSDAVRDTTRRLLERAGYVVHAAENGAVALRRWHEVKGAYDLVVTDVRMPELGGVELAAR